MFDISHDVGPDGQVAACWEPGDPAWVRVPGSSTGARVLLLRRWAHVRAALIGDGHIRNLAEVDAEHALAGVRLQRPGGLLRLAPPQTVVRETLNRVWRPAAVEEFRSALAWEAARLARQVAAGPDADLVASFAVPLARVMLTVMTGLTPAGADQLSRLSDATTGTLLLCPADHEPAARAWDRVYELTGPVIATARARPDGTLISRSVAAMDAAGLTPDEVSDAGTTIFTGGPTIQPVLVRLLEYVMRRPHIIAACRLDPALIPAAVNAALREAAHFTFGLPGVATKAVSVDDSLTIRPGMVVLPVIHAAIADRASAGQHWHTPGPGLAWGAGVHACLGRHLANVVLQEAVGAVAAELDGWQLAPDPLAWSRGTMPGLAALPVRASGAG